MPFLIVFAVVALVGVRTETQTQPIVPDRAIALFNGRDLSGWFADVPEKDGNVQYTVRLGAATSDDKAYNGMDADDLTVTNIDNETAGVTVDAAANLQTNEGGGTATFTVVLNTQPSADVSIALASTDLSEGTVAPATLVFTAANWKSPQTATITGVQDDEADGTQVFKIFKRRCANQLR